MATQTIEHPATAAIPTNTKDEIAERLAVLGQRIEALAQAVIDATDGLDCDAGIDQRASRTLNFVAWPLLDAARESGRQIVDLGVKLEVLS